MSWTAVQEPIQANTDRYIAAYGNAGVIWKWKDSDLIAAKANNGGKLQVQATTLAQANRLSVGDYIYLTILENQDNVDSPFVQITSRSGSDITVDLDYAVYTADVEEIRFTFTQDFTIDTGYSLATQPNKTSTLKVKPDRDGLYSIDARRFVVSRFLFDAPENTDIDSSCRFQVYPSSESAPTAVIALKQNTAYAANTNRLAYTDLQMILSERDGDRYYDRKTIEPSSTITLADDGTPTTTHSYVGETIDVDFQTLINDANGAGDALPPGLAFKTQNSGQELIGLTGTFTGTYDLTWDFEDTVTGVTVAWALTVHSVLEARSLCKSDYYSLMWWDYTGGWQTYVFENGRELNIAEGEAVRVAGQYDQRVTAYEDVMKSVILTAKLEGESVLDILNTLPLSTQIYKVDYDSAGNIDTYTRMFCADVARTLKRHPYKGASNRFQIELYFSDIIMPANED